MKTNSKVNQTSIDSSPQVLHKAVWKPSYGGGKLREYEKDEEGFNLVRIIKEEEIKPNEKYYMIDAYKKNHFYETSFSKDVEWDTVLEFLTTKKIYIKNGNKGEISKGEGARVRATSQRLF